MQGRSQDFFIWCPDTSSRDQNSKRILNLLYLQSILISKDIVGGSSKKKNSP